jgi:putative serine protease PepD
MTTLKKFFIASIFFVALFSLLLGNAEAITQDEANNIEVYQRVSPGVVNIVSVVVKYDFFYNPIPQKGTGSGAVIDVKGYIITNSHVIQNAQSLEVTLADGSKWPAVLIGSDPDNDLAVIMIKAPPEKISVITMGDSSNLQVGQKVLAIGNPFGLGQTLTTGVISSLGRNIRVGTGSIIRNLIQTDAAINPGNSGGPLLNSKGEMIGLNTAILSPTGANVGVGFAIPVDTVKDVTPRLISGKFSYFGLKPLVFYGAVVLFFYLLWRRTIAT